MVDNYSARYDMVIDTPKFFFMHNTTIEDTGYMTREKSAITGRLGTAKVRKAASHQADKFKIIRVPSPATQVPGPKPGSEATEESSQAGIYVAIEADSHDMSHKEYLSSGRSSYNRSITDTETFLMKYVALDDSFVFQATNGHYLHYNETLLSIGFKTCKERAPMGFPFKGRWKLLDVNNQEGNVSGYQKAFEVMEDFLY